MIQAGQKLQAVGGMDLNPAECSNSLQPIGRFV